MFEQTKNLCALFLKMGIPGFDLIVYKDGKPALRHMGGYADPENKIPMQGKEKYHIYSCSKLFTCVAAMQLWENGLFSLEDEVAAYLPAFREMTVKTADGVRPAKKPILIHQLFSMSSGMNYDLTTPAIKAVREETGGRCPTVQTVNALAKTPLEFEPGEGWLYSLSHDVLGALVEVLSGEKFEDYAKAHIFDPLGMTHTTYMHPMEDWEGFARQYHYNEQENAFTPWWRNGYRVGTEYASGGAGCVSTVEDYIKFLEALRVGDVILKKETVALMAADRMPKQFRHMYSFGGDDIGYGLGMRTPVEGGKRTEFGWGGAAGAFASVDVVNNITIYYAQHVLNSPNRPLRKSIYDAVLADIKGEKLELQLPEGPFDLHFTY